MPFLQTKQVVLLTYASILRFIGGNVETESFVYDTFEYDDVTISYSLLRDVAL